MTFLAKEVEDRRQFEGRNEIRNGNASCTVVILGDDVSEKRDAEVRRKQSDLEANFALF